MTSRHHLPLDEVNLFSTLGMELVEQSPERVVATMPFDQRVSQLTGQFHGGAIVALADTAA
ncbi:MAG: hotdog fold thioesterase, partial [Chloroflexi bacterium]|nr:hotdog fold thioesterase [Chloroflexota bacterium]